MLKAELQRRTQATKKSVKVGETGFLKGLMGDFTQKR
jgi:hypothetical protein